MQMKINTMQYTVPVQDEPGQLNRICQMLNKEGVNILGICCPRPAA